MVDIFNELKLYTKQNKTKGLLYPRERSARILAKSLVMKISNVRNFWSLHCVR